MKKRIMSTFLAIIMVLSLLPGGAFANGNVTREVSNAQELQDAVADSTVDEIILTSSSINEEVLNVIDRSLTFTSAVGGTTLYSHENEPHFAVFTEDEITLRFNGVTLNHSQPTGIMQSSGGIQHSSDTGLKIYGARIVGCGIGVNSRGDYLEIYDSEITGCDYGIQAYDYTTPGKEQAISLNDVDIHDNLIGLNLEQGEYDINLSDTTIRYNTSQAIKLVSAYGGTIDFEDSSIAENTDGSSMYGHDGIGIYAEDSGSDYGLGGTAVLTLNNPVISKNIGGAGSAITSTMRLIVNGGIIDGNQSQWEGGAIYLPNRGDHEFYDTVITNNTSSGGGGGAIYVGSISEMIMEGVYFEGNSNGFPKSPPQNVDALLPNIDYLHASIHGHPANDYDICQTFSDTVVTDEKVISSVESVQAINVPVGTSRKELVNILNLERPVTVVLDDDSERVVAEPWTVSELPITYDGEEEGNYQISSVISVPYTEDFSNVGRPAVKAEITVTVEPVTTITSIPPVTLNEITPQSFVLGETDRPHDVGGVPSTIVVPETVTVNLSDNTTEELPVEWIVNGDETAEPGVKIIEGNVVLDPNMSPKIENPDNLKAEMEIDVEAVEYEVITKPDEEISIEVYPGTTLAEIEEKLSAEGKTTLDVEAISLTYNDIVYLYTDFIIEESKNGSYNKDEPGNYTIIGSFTGNFRELDEYLPGPIEVSLTVLEPLEITGYAETSIGAYQSVEAENFTNIPNQVEARLENDEEILIDVEWDWSNYNKDIAGQQMVIGRFTNLPSKARQGDIEIYPVLKVNVEAVEYEITGMLSDNMFETYAGLTLEQITEREEPKIEYEITSVTDGIDFTTTYEVDVLLETDKNPDYNQYASDYYILIATLNLPSNITYADGNFYDEAILYTVPVDIESVEPAFATTKDGVEFDDIDKPATVRVNLTNGESVPIEVEWDGTGFDTNPAGLTEDNHVEQEMYGELIRDYDTNGYINFPAPEAPKLTVTTVLSYHVHSISPVRIPEIGAMDVNLGTSLSEIYDMLNSHTVEVTLRSNGGSEKVITTTFTLPDSENSHYVPLTLGTYELEGSLMLTDIDNPGEIQPTIVVRTMKYNITSIDSIRLTGVESGTAFGDIGAPEFVVASLRSVTDSTTKDEEVGVNWDSSTYNPTRLGSQVVRGTLETPLPLHIENTNNRQPSMIVTVVNPTVRILSLEQIAAPMMLRMTQPVIEGYREVRYNAKLQQADGTITTEVISLFVEA